MTSERGLTRRELLAASLAITAGAPGPPIPDKSTKPPPTPTPLPSTRSLRGVDIVPRSQWGGDLAPKGPLTDETDVRVLVVHHSVSSNTYSRAGVRGMLRGIYGFHTGPEKRWPDVAYSFFVDRFGGIWEGRTGSLSRPVAGSATGGNQGYTRLVCLLGDFGKVTPSAEMTAALSGLLAALADEHGIDTRPNATATFVSRGSNRFPKGNTVTVPTITGHRALSQTSCPGDAANELITSGRLAHLVTSHRKG